MSNISSLFSAILASAICLSAQTSLPFQANQPALRPTRVLSFTRLSFRLHICSHTLTKLSVYSRLRKIFKNIDVHTL